MELRLEYYIVALLGISGVFFATVASLLGGTEEAYRDFLITIAVTHFIMTKLVTIQKNKAPHDKL